MSRAQIRRRFLAWHRYADRVERLALRSSWGEFGPGRGWGRGDAYMRLFDQLRHRDRSQAAALLGEVAARRPSLPGEHLAIADETDAAVDEWVFATRCDELDGGLPFGGPPRVDEAIIAGAAEDSGLPIMTVREVADEIMAMMVGGFGDDEADEDDEYGPRW